MLIKPSEWNKIDWASIEIKVYNLQTQIYKASILEKGLPIKFKTRALQNKLIKTMEAKLLAIRKVTQDNQGKKTEGVDGKKSLTPNERMRLLDRMHLDGHTSVIRRVWIAKSNGKLRPLGISTIQDRAKQWLVLLALEPEWESVFEPNSYGFRPGYSPKDAKFAIVSQIKSIPKYFLDADIKGCFDNIDHNYLLSKINQSRMITQQIKSWLKAGVLSNFKGNSKVKTMDVNQKGTPQGGVISPLLANIALHGLEYAVMGVCDKNVRVVRYADDFLVFAATMRDINKALLAAVTFLKLAGLELSKEKTRIANTMVKYGDQNPGFDFLGFHFVLNRCSISRGVKNTKGVKRPWKQWNGPSGRSIESHKAKLRLLIRKLQNAPLKAIISALSHKIKGWTNYFAFSKCTSTFSTLDGWLWKRLWKMTIKRYKSAKAAKKACWSVKGWKFGFKEVIKDSKKTKDIILNRHDQTNVEEYKKIKPGASIYNSDTLLYFAKRLRAHNKRLKGVQGLLKKQGYKCKKCNLVLKATDHIEIHHVLNAEMVRTKEFEILHNYCHDQAHATTGIQK